MHELNEKQREAANFMFGTASVIAIPGSGKTLTMAARIGNLVKSGIAPDKILGLAFTRNAAWAMRDKLQPVLYDQAAQVTLSTIHAFCHRLLQESGHRFEMLYGRRQVYLIRKVIKRLRLNDLTAGFMLREIGIAKCQLMCAQRFYDLRKDDKTKAAVAKIHASGKQCSIAGGSLVGGQFPSNWAKATTAGVDAILTDYPLVLRQRQRTKK